MKKEIRQHSHAFSMPSRRSATATSTTGGAVAVHRGMAERERALRARFKDTGLSPATARAFRSLVQWFYRTQGRNLPWRDGVTPYRVFVSEVMLQQTQVGRVAEKFPLFVREFPGFAALAGAPLARVLQAWQGMGYNRRALSLKRAAEIVIDKFGGTLPSSPAELQSLPGIGAATAASIAAYAFNTPTVFIETNIRAVIIHYFFAERDKITDDEIIPVVKTMMDRKNPNDWYNGMMDVGTWLKAAHGNPAARSSRHRPQSAFAGSIRQVRGALLRQVLKTGTLKLAYLRRTIGVPPERFDAALTQLCAEGFICRNGGTVSVASHARTTVAVDPPAGCIRSRRARLRG